MRSPTGTTGNRKAAEKEGHPGIHGREIWRKKCGRRASGTVGRRWRRQHKPELDGDRCSTGSETTDKSTKSSQKLQDSDRFFKTFSARDAATASCSRLAAAVNETTTRSNALNQHNVQK